MFYTADDALVPAETKLGNGELVTFAVFSEGPAELRLSLGKGATTVRLSASQPLRVTQELVYARGDTFLLVTRVRSALRGRLSVEPVSTAPLRALRREAHAVSGDCETDALVYAEELTVEELAESYAERGAGFRVRYSLQTDGRTAEGEQRFQHDPGLLE